MQSFFFNVSIKYVLLSISISWMCINPSSMPSLVEGCFSQISSERQRILPLSVSIIQPLSLNLIY
ncbi:Uncharacterized protein CTYZ_00001300 [Cryptosporidium tyzzeri]|nr:Uncharacterized protein CTYZ_00001300 [Cryptosporidium tyzzeri]